MCIIIIIIIVIIIVIIIYVAASRKQARDFCETVRQGEIYKLSDRAAEESRDRHISSIPSCTCFKCTRSFWYVCLMFVLISEHEQRLRKGVTSTKKSTYIRSTYKREC